MSNCTINHQQLALIFKALGNPHRLALLHRLVSCCAPGTRCNAEQAMGVCVGSLGDGLEIAPSTLSHHLKELHRAGLIQMERQGKNVVCWVDPEPLAQIGAFFNIPVPQGETS
ncbi:MAG: metalloregulator ArsR/SmtB family transcription factor [Gammaproteobacteria bacterium]|nr:metalloregulator ArsR/SmtB family transcription factor [Gammaproteobacteria bacterium]